MNPIRVMLAAGLLTVTGDAISSTQVYEVDPAYRSEVVEILRELLDVGMSEFGGSVELLPTGQIVVDTYTDARQEQIRVVLEAIARGERLNARLTIEHELQELHIELALTKGEFVVLGAGTSGQIVEDGVLALVVNWPDDD